MLDRITRDERKKKNLGSLIIIIIIILLSHLIIRLSSALVPSLDDKSRNRGWSTSLIRRGTPVVTVSSSRPPFFRPLFLARGYIRGPDAKVCAAHFNELAIPSCFPAVWVSTAEGRRRLPRGARGGGGGVAGGGRDGGADRNRKWLRGGSCWRSSPPTPRLFLISLG